MDDLRVLCETGRWRLGHSYESVVVVDKRDGRAWDAGDHYGDPAVGVITRDERWFCSGGEGVQCFALDGTLLSFFRSDGRGGAGPRPWFVETLAEVEPGVLEVTFDEAALGTWTITLPTGRVARLDRPPA